jgi:hypothetical protein
LVLGILFQAAGQSILQAVRKAKVVVAQENPNAASQAGPFLRSARAGASVANLLR